MATIVKRYEMPATIPEKGGGKRITEQAGYIPPKIQIEQFMLAGRRLEAYRKEQYDFSDGIDNGYSDPTRSPNFDLADASLLGDPAYKGVETALDEVEANRANARKKDEEELAEYRKQKAASAEKPILE